MIAVIGLGLDEIKNELENFKKKNNGICEIANDNADGQVIISGEKSTIESFKLYLKNKEIKSIPLKVSAPFHCSLMRPAAEIMKSKLKNIKFKSPSIPLVYNVTANPKKNDDDVKKMLIEQIVSTVRWRESIIYMSKSGVTDFIEIGPGKVLTGMVKRTIKNANCFSINSIADIQNLKR
tara:strand:- start:91 stop:627 length:537 start_codon:yes stop_codon:yes gene_type:complete